MPDCTQGDLVLLRFIGELSAVILALALVRTGPRAVWAVHAEREVVDEGDERVSEMSKHDGYCSLLDLLLYNGDCRYLRRLIRIVA